METWSRGVAFIAPLRARGICKNCQQPDFAAVRESGAILALSLGMGVILSPLADQVIGGAIEVHRALGPGLLESAYQRCLERELQLRGVVFKRQVNLPVIYKGQLVDCCYRIDLFVQEELVVEVKSVETLLPVHSAQAITYMKLVGANQALLMNFNVPMLKSGLKSFINQPWRG